MFSEATVIAQIAAVTSAAILLAGLAGARWGVRRERKRQERNEVVAVLQALRNESARNFDEMRVRLRHLESLVETKFPGGDGKPRERGREPDDHGTPQP